MAENKIGLVIGKGGSKIMEVRKTSGCAVEIDKEKMSANGEKIVMLEVQSDQFCDLVEFV